MKRLGRLGRASLVVSVLAGSLYGQHPFARAEAPRPTLGPATTLRFELPRAATTSAGVYDASGHLVRTLWRGEALPAGAHRRTWNGLDDLGHPAPAGEYGFTLLHHRIRYVWEGVVGNSSLDQGGPRVHRSYLPPSSLAIAGDTVYYAVGFNEQQPGIHGFHADAPQFDTRPFDSTDTFASYTLLATDGARLYWANGGGLSRTSFVSAYDIEHQASWAFPQGETVCLNPRPNGGACYEGHTHSGVIDLRRDEGHAATGLAVQARGHVLAVAHGHQGVIRLYDKTSGAALRELRLPLASDASNQIAMTDDGDLWVVIAGSTGAQLQRYSQLESAPMRVATLEGLTRPLALAPAPDGTLWVADGGTSQQLKHFDASGRLVQVIGRAGGYALGPEVSDDKLCFVGRDRREQAAVAIAPDATLWVADTCNNRMLHYRIGAQGHPHLIDQVAYLPAFYTSTVDHANPRRVFANFLEFDADLDTPWVAGRSWQLVRNWLGGMPAALVDKRAFNGLFGGLLSVETLGNGRTYGLLMAHDKQAVVELPAAGPMRLVNWLAAPLPGSTLKVMYENGDLGYALTGPTAQQAMRLPLTGFDDNGDPAWAREPVVLARVPTQAGTPYYRGAFSGMPPRFPLTGSGRVVFFDQSISGNEGFHLGVAARGGMEWLWQASPTGPLDGAGSYQTRALDGSLHYGGNAVWAHGRHIVYGYHGEFYKDLQTGRVGQANQFMHFDESGLFLGQFGQSSTRPADAHQTGMSGNAFSPTLVAHGGKLFLYHNDESSHGGVHRWRIDGASDVQTLGGSGTIGETIDLR